MFCMAIKMQQQCYFNNDNVVNFTNRRVVNISVISHAKSLSMIVFDRIVFYGQSEERTVWTQTISNLKTLNASLIFYLIF